MPGKIIRLYKKYKQMLISRGIRYSVDNIINEFNSILIRVKSKMAKSDRGNVNSYREFCEYLYTGYAKKTDFYIPYKKYDLKNTRNDLKLIAFYLPQFHPIPENDEWWGKGFTEWTNVSKALPQFAGHYQPHLPGELGFYDLRISDVQKRQAELAENYGITGFCFYYYWFGGRRILEMPLDRFAGNQAISFPFCICWANENWTKRWDGRDEEILLRQNYEHGDDVNFIKSIFSYIENERYIRVEGKPLIIIYRPSSLPDMKKTAETWRSYCKENGVGDIFLAYTTSSDNFEPEKFGFDAAIEFPPNNIMCKEITDRYILMNKEFSGKIYDYSDLIRRCSEADDVKYQLFRGITPGWDNSARKIKDCKIFQNSTPETFKKWLEDICSFTIGKYPAGRRFIFINAWNEWAEGAHLEPDRKFGYAYLDAIAEVVKAFNPNNDGQKK